ncbi:MAG: hypothetical protein AAFR76_07230 [Planctomycetota bacterium]
MMRRFANICPNTLLITGLALSALAMAGCKNIWRDHYRPIGSIEALPSSSAIEIREIPWERMERAIAEAQTRAADSDIHPSEWDETTKVDARGELLRNLQIQADPADVRVVGVSSFRTTDIVRPWDGALADFAGEVGADLVVWSDRYMGKADAIVDRTVYVDSIGDARDLDDDERTRFRSETFNVPIVVQKDERGYTAFFLRRASN